MKKILFSITIIINLSFCYASEPCGTVTNCPNKAYPYIMCDPNTGEVRECCVNNPITDRCLDEFGNVFGPVRRGKIPICFDFDNSIPDSVIGYICGVSNDKHDRCYADIIFRKTDFLLNANDASNLWNCLCGYDNNSCDCHIKVSFISKNNNEFNDPSRDFVMNTLTKHNPPASNQVINKCEINCNNIKIYLNNLPEFTKATTTKDVNGFEVVCHHKFYFIDEYLESNLQGTNPNSYNIKNVLTRELGEILGLGDLSKCINTDGQSMMSGEIRLNQNLRKQLSNDDICMFKKLYCPNLTPVVEKINEMESELNLFPNPSENLLNISFFVESSSFPVTIQIFNIYRVKILDDIKKYYNEGANTEIIDLSNMVNGIYYYTISIDLIKYQGKFAINR